MAAPAAAGRTMSKQFHEVYAEQEVGPPPERSTGFVFAAVSAIVALIFRDSTTVLGIAGTLCVLFLGASLIKPSLLRPLNLVWFRFSLLLHRIVNPVVLGILFVVAILPFGLVMRIFRDPMRNKRASGPTYWVKRGPASDETHSMSNQF